MSWPSSPADRCSSRDGRRPAAPGNASPARPGSRADAEWPRLAEYANRARKKAADERAKAEARLWLADRDEREAEAAEGLLAFVEDLRRHLDAVEQAESWRAAATATTPST